MKETEERNTISILLTACINPNGMSYTVLQNPEERKQQYLNALNFYLNNTSLPIVFVENSGYDISKEYEEYISTNRLEIHTFNGNDYDKSLGKGYGEALIILYAQHHSNIIQNSKYTIKITGRLIIRNINETIPYNILKDDDVVICDFQPNVNLLTTYFIIPPTLLSNICKEGLSSLNDTKGTYFEHILYEGICRNKEVQIIPFRITPIIEGICGSSGQLYSAGLSSDRTFTNIEYLSKYYKNTNRNNEAEILDIIYQYINKTFTKLNKDITNRQEYIDEITKRDSIKQEEIEKLYNLHRQNTEHIQILNKHIDALNQNSFLQQQSITNLEKRNREQKIIIKRLLALIAFITTICLIYLVLLSL